MLNILLFSLKKEELRHPEGAPVEPGEVFGGGPNAPMCPTSQQL